jgi:hypothetical protein
MDCFVALLLAMTSLDRRISRRRNPPTGKPRERLEPVIASEVKQFILPPKEGMNGFVAEPVIGRAFATRWLPAYPLSLHTRLSGASGARHSLRPLFEDGGTKGQSSRDRRGENAEVRPDDAPLFEIRIRGHALRANAAHSFIVPAHAGTHNHRRLW